MREENLINKSDLAPIVLFAYNRPEHVRRTLQALNQNKLADETKLYIFIDGPRNQKDLERVIQVREEIKNFRVRNRFQEVYVDESESNKGLAKSVIDGVDKIIKEYGRVIVVEDDILTAPDFLLFMNSALEYYEDDKRVWSISGYTFANKKILKRCKQDVFAFYRGSSWGWSTWKDRWELTDWSLSDYSEFIKDKKRKESFSRGGSDLPLLLEAKVQGEIDSWSIIFDYEQSKRDKLTIYPRFPKAVNIGLDGTGRHCYDINNHIEIDSLQEQSFELMPVLIDKCLMKLCKDYFSPEETMRGRIITILRSVYHKILRRNGQLSGRRRRD